MADWAPVEHDPFSSAPAPQAAAATGGWAPVEHDPFAKAEPKATEGAPEPEAGVFQTMANDLHRQRAAASQGTTPNLGAHEKNLISDDVHVGDDDNLYFKDAEGKLQRADTNKHVVLPDNNGKLRVFSRSDETNEGRASSLGRLLGTGMGAGRFDVSKAAAPLSRAMEAASNIGVDVPRAIMSESPAMHLGGQVVAKAPGGAPLYKAITQGVEDLGGAADRAVGKAGGVADAKRAGEGVTTGLEEGFKPQTKQLVSQLYDRVDKLVDPKATAPLTNTQKTVADILAKKQAYGNEDLGPAVNAVAGALKRPGGLTYEAIKNLRTSIGEMVKNKFLPPNISQQELNGIYGALSKDLGDAAEITGGKGARAAWQVANDAAAARSGALKTLDKVIGPKTRADEGVVDVLHRMAKGGPSADIDTLTAARKALSRTPGAWEDVASTVIDRLGKNKAGEFSPALFVRDYGDLSPAGRRMLFHSVGSGDVVPFLNDIAEVSQKYIDAGKLGNPSGSAGHGAAMAAFGTAAASLAHGDFATPIVILAGVIGNNVVAKVLSAPATAASAARWTRAYDNVVRTPGARTIAAYNVASKNLAGTTAASSGDPTLAPRLADQIKGAVHQSRERTDQQYQ